MNCNDMVLRTALRLKANMILVVVMSLMSVSACSDFDLRQERDSDNISELSLTLDGSSFITKGDDGVQDMSVVNLSVFVYSEGQLVTDRYYTSFDSMRIPLEKDLIYDVYVLANTGRVLPPVLESELPGLRCGTGNGNMPFPMCWSRHDVSPVTQPSLIIALERLVARVMLEVDCQVPGLEVRSVCLAQAPSSVRPFDPAGNRIVSSDDVTCLHASENEVQILNKKGKLTFHVLENMQGTLLEGNEDPMAKIPDNIGEAAGLCTYLDVECAFGAGSDKEGSVSYRMFVGKDNSANFDVQRNHVLNVVLALTPSGLGIEDSWKVVSDYVQHVKEIILDRNDLEMVVGCRSVLHAQVLPEDAHDKSVLWISSDPDVAAVDSEGNVYAISEGNCVVSAVSMDRSGIRASCRVAVVPVAPEKVELNFVELELPLGDSFEAKYRVIYNDGTATGFLSDGMAVLEWCTPEGWNVSDSGVASVSDYGIITPNAVGLTELSMTVSWWDDDEYITCAASGTVIVRDAYLTDVFILAPAMFYEGSGGPGLYGLFSDGSQRDLVADEWVSSVPNVEFNETYGFEITDAGALVPGETICTFTAFYKDMEVSVDMLYGKWGRELKCEKTPVSGYTHYRYRAVLRYDDFSEKYVPFEYMTSNDGVSWEYGGRVSEKGVELPTSIKYVRVETSEKYHNYKGELQTWTTTAR